VTGANRARRLPAILFDMDGTLLDSIELILQSAEFAFEGRERKPSRAEWQALIGTPLDVMLRNWASDEEDLLALRARYREFQLANHHRLVRIYDGVPEVLAELHARGHPMAIVSSKLDRGIRMSMDYFDLTKYFDVIVGIESTKHHKPHPEPVLFALNKLGVKPTEAVFVGDSPHDVEAGNAAGVPVIACTWGAYTRDEIAAASPAKCFDDVRGLLHAFPAALTQ
jgi:pyrophosphatase PpaX